MRQVDTPLKQKYVFAVELGLMPMRRGGLPKEIAAKVDVTLEVDFVPPALLDQSGSVSSDQLAGLAERQPRKSILERKLPSLAGSCCHFRIHLHVS